MDISNVVFYLVDDNGDLVKSIKFDYTEDGITDGTQPESLFGEVLDLANMDGLSVSGYTIKAGQMFYDFGIIPDGATPEDQTDVYAEFEYTPSSGEIDPASNGIQTAQSPGLVSPQIAVNGPELDGYAYAVEVNTAGVPLDATLHLGEVESIATAVANNVTIDSEVMIEAHQTQIAFGGFGDDAIDPAAAVAVGSTFGALYQPDSDGYTGNIGIASALTLMVAGAAGIIDPGQVDALSRVEGVLNASVDSDATAVANNKSLSLDAVTADDAVLIADATQFSYMNVSATSDVSRVSINGYENLGLNGPSSEVLNRPIVSSVATAVGNNLTVSVSSP
jgi:hypothetical protein